MILIIKLISFYMNPSNIYLLMYFYLSSTMKVSHIKLWFTSYKERKLCVLTQNLPFFGWSSIWLN